MSRRAVDLEAVRQARQRLEELAREHPEAFDSERLPTTPEAVARAMRPRGRIGRPPSPDPTVAVAARIPRSMLQALDALAVERRRTDPDVTRQDLLREAVRRLLTAEKRKACHAARLAGLPEAP
jgi:hypothetical protein